MINWFKLLYSINHYSPMVRIKSSIKDYSIIYYLLRIDDELLYFTFFNNPETVGFQIMFFTYNIRRNIREYSITLAAFSNNGRIRPVYVTDNYMLHNIFNGSMCKYLIYYMYLETDKARQLIDEVLEEYKDE